MTLVEASNAAQSVASVLVVEAEVLIRTAVAEYLRKCGYDVLEAGNAGEAMALLQADDKVEVAFIDLGPPGDLDGFGLARWIRRERPDVKTILTSGVQRTVQEAGDLCEHGPALTKPYHHQELERRIRQLLAK